MGSYKSVLSLAIKNQLLFHNSQEPQSLFVVHLGSLSGHRVGVVLLDGDIGPCSRRVRCLHRFVARKIFFHSLGIPHEAPVKMRMQIVHTSRKAIPIAIMTGTYSRKVGRAPAWKLTYIY